MADLRQDINGVDRHVGRMIRLYRKAAGLTQIELSRMLDVPSRKLNKFEQGVERVSPKILRNICMTLKIRPIALFETLEAEAISNVRVSRHQKRSVL